MCVCVCVCVARCVVHWDVNLNPTSTYMECTLNNINCHSPFLSQDARLTMEIKYHGHQDGEEGASDDEPDKKARPLIRRKSSRKLTVRKKLKIVEPSGAASDVESEGAENEQLCLK